MKTDEELREAGRQARLRERVTNKYEEPSGTPRENTLWWEGYNQSAILPHPDHCWHCGMIHPGMQCPRIKKIHYYPNGQVESVEYHEPKNHYYPEPKKDSQ